jgi:prolyl oligopeptidase
MTRRIFALSALLACSTAAPPPAATDPAASAAAAQAASTGAPAPPVTRKDAIIETIHGQSVADPYRWLEDEKSAEVQAWMSAQDAFARAELANLPGRAAYEERLKGLLYVDSRGAPAKRGKRYFYWKKAADQEKAVHYWQEGEAGEPKVLLDPNTLSADGSISVTEVVPSEDGQLVAYMERGNNADEATLRVMEVATGQVRAGDSIPGLRYTSASWSPDGNGFYYTWIPSDPAIPTNERMGYGEVRYHALGTDPAKDPVLREKTGDPTRWQGASVSKDGKYLFLTISHGWSETDLYVRFLTDKKRAGTWVPLAVGTKAIYSAVAHKDRFYVITNDGAPRFQAYLVDPNKLDKKQWKLVIPEDAEAVLDNLDVVGGHLALTYLRNATTELEVRTLAGKPVRKIALPTLGTSSGLYGRPDDDVAYFSFSSFVYPEEIYRTNIKTGETKVYAQVKAPVTPGDYVVEQHRYPSKDGTPISIFVVHKKGLTKNGENPTMLYGYGGFNISLTPAFTALAVPFLDEGGVYAVANLRGGGEYGEAWHQAGMLAKKQNVFDDFIAAAEWLQKEGYTKPARLGIRGGSNGGLLVGTAMTQRPELYGAVICAVPLLDMVRYHDFGVGQAWVPEYGSADDPAQFATLYAYSPYHHVEAGKSYPPLLMLSADHDDRVDPMHARKFVAQVQGAGAKVAWLRIEKHAGHGGADLRRQAVAQAADTLAFLKSQLSR